MSGSFNNILENISFMSSSSLKPAENSYTSWFFSWGENKTQEPEASGLLGWGKSLKDRTNASMTVLNGAVSRASRLKHFFLFLALSVVLFIGSFMFLPMVLIFPQKFALLFSLGSICIQVSFSYLRSSGWEYAKYLFSSRDNAALTGLYFFTLFWTVYAAMISQSYIQVIIATITQLFIILYFLFSLVPGGTSGLISMFKYGLKMCCCNWFGGSLLPI